VLESYVEIGWVSQFISYLNLTCYDYSGVRVCQRVVWTCLVMVASGGCRRPPEAILGFHHPLDVKTLQLDSCICGKGVAPR
jgi:hypothetical protein